MSFKSNRSGTTWVDWGKVDSAPVEVIEAIKSNLPHIISQMPWNEQMELLGNYNNKTSNPAQVKADVKAKMATGGNQATDIAELQATVESLLSLLQAKMPKIFK